MLGHGSRIGRSRSIRYRTFDDGAPLRRVFETVVVCILVWILVGSAIVNVTRQVSLIVRREGQIGSAGSESELVTTARVLVASVVVVVVSRELLEVGVQLVFVPTPASLLDHEEDRADNDTNADQANDGKSSTHGPLILQEAMGEVSVTTRI